MLLNLVNCILKFKDVISKQLSNTDMKTALYTVAQSGHFGI